MILLIIWGSKGRTKSVGKGEFFCPRCQHSTPYEHMKAARYFTLYFIPLFPTQTLGEWVKCAHCQGEYDLQVLQLSPQEITRLTSPWQCTECENRNPPDAAECLGCRRPRRASA